MSEDLSQWNLLPTLADPVRYSREILGHNTWALQNQILTSVAKNPRTAVKACHASGKTFMAAEASLWWVTNFSDGLVITTAPTWNQVELVLWPEIHRAIGTSLIQYPKPNNTNLKLGPGNQIVGLSTNQGVRFQGFHGKILIVLDEATGIQPDIWEAIEGIRAGGDVRLLALGNPTVASGPFYDAFTGDVATWSTFTISAFSTPNLSGLDIDTLLKWFKAGDERLEQNTRPYLVQRRWVVEKYLEWTPESPIYQARVLGQFPDQATGALYPLSWLERAQSQEVAGEAADLEAGIDVAGPGEDETVVYIRSLTGDIVNFRAWTIPDPRGECVAFLDQYRARLRRVKVDSVGLGFYFARHLEDQGFPVVDVNVGLEPTTKPGDKLLEKLGGDEKFANLKAEIYWTLRQWLYRGEIRGLKDRETFKQLVAILYEHTPLGQIKIEAKKDAVKRGVDSPDRAEALILAFAKVDPTPSFMQFTENQIESSRIRAEEAKANAPKPSVETSRVGYPW